MVSIFWTLCLVLPVVGSVRTGTIRQKSPCPFNNTVTPFKALTFNTILVDNAWNKNNLTIPNNRLDRRSSLINYLQNSDADVVCLQEVYIGDDVEAIVSGLSGQYPHSHSQLHFYNGILPPQSTGIRASVCDLSAMVALANCTTTAGCDIESADAALALCISTNCAAEYANLILTGGTKCLSCILSSDAVNRNTKCVSPGPAVGLWDMNPMGLLLLSKQPFENRLAVPYYPGVVQTLKKGHLQVTINGEINVACTHPSPNDLFSFEPILSEFIPNASGQNDFETADIIRRLKDVVPLLLLGDFNMGPRGPNLLPVKEVNYQSLAAEFNTISVKECTFCSTNPHNNGDNTDVDAAIDHIFGNGALKITNPKVVLKTDDAFVTTDGRVLPISDHYGVEATVICQCDGTTSKKQRKAKRYRNYRSHRRVW